MRPPRAFLLGLGLCMAACGAAQELAIGFLTQADDNRYHRGVLTRRLPGAPAGRSHAAAELALQDATFTLRQAGMVKARIQALEAADAAAVPAALEQLARSGVRHVLLELPAAGVRQALAAARPRGLVLYNVAAPEDALRGADCAPAQLLHTLPSHAMQADAIGQFLVARRWRRLLVLAGPTPADAQLAAAFERTVRRYGLQPVARKPFKLSNDPRERDLGNPRLVTAGAEHDAVVVLDADGEFARDLPYRTQLPRPVVGSAGLVAQAWSAVYERHGAPQLTRRFARRAGRTMTGHDWATWIATRAIVEAVARKPAADALAQARPLREGEIGLDGYKGQRLTFRRWDGQLRQPLMLVHGHAVAELAPLEGFLHPKTTLDTLGFDAPESPCKAAP